MLLTVVIFFIILSILVLVHELGHFLAAKKAGIKVEEFGLGYPPRVWGKKIGETLYSINALPFGGFVRLYGEELADRVKENKRAFWAKSKKVRTAVITAGVLANFLLAVVVFSVVYSVIGIPTKIDQVKIIELVPGSPAETGGLQIDDVVLSVDGEPLGGLSNFVGLIEEKKGAEVTLLVERVGEEFLLAVTPREDPPEEEGPLGVVITDMEMKKFPLWQMPFRGAAEGFKEAFGWTTLIVGGLKEMVFNLAKGNLPKDIAGPIGILQITGGVARSGALAVLQFMGILSVNLAVINILPFPALDGGRLVFILYEVVTRKRPKPSFERWTNAIGMAILVFLLILVSINDLRRLITTTDLLSRLRSLWPF